MADPFEFVVTDGRGTTGLKPPNCFVERELSSPPVTVAVGSGAIWIVDRSSACVKQVIGFPQGFPSWRSKYSALGNRSFAAIGADGSVVFHANDRLYVWRLASGELRFVADDSGEPEAIAVSPAGTRAASLRRSSDWVTRVWSLTNGELLATLRWNNLYPGSLSSFDFSSDGDGLGIQTDVTAQSGDDFTENFGWDLGAGPETR